MYVSLIFSLLLYTSCSFYARYLYSSLLSVYLSIAVDTTFLLFLLVTLSPSVERNGTGANKASTSAKKSKAASIMRATLSRRDQQRLNCIRDSRRTAHKFSSRRRRAILLLNTFSRVPVIRRILNATSPPFFFISRLSKDLQPSECSSFRLEPPV